MLNPIIRMSINYGPQPHAVDIPVTDIDDPDDDVLFNEQSNHTSGGADDDSFLDGLDYEDPTPRAGIVGRIQSLFKGRSGQNSYEMLETGGFSGQRVEPPTKYSVDPVRVRRDFNIDRLNSKIKHTVIGGLLIIVLLVIVILYLTGKVSNSPYYGLSNGITKRILSNGTHPFHPTTIMISLDGFHPHYISKKVTPTLHEMLLHEYGPPYMTPSFPSSTFPNHWTLITGLHPSEHGIVSNTFYDPLLKKKFVYTNPKVGGLDPDFWQGGEPLWTTAAKHGVRSAVHMWPGSEVPTVGPPTDFDRFNGSELLSVKVDRILGWIDRELITERPELILGYVPTVDHFGHEFGISGPELTKALTYVDNFVALIKKELSIRNLDDIVNLVFVSDHGMAPTSNHRLLYLDDLLDLSKIQYIDGWPLFGLRPYKEFSVDEVLRELQTNFDKLDKKTARNYRIFKTEDLPKEWAYGGKLHDHKFNYRLAPLWVVPEVGYSITTHKQMEDMGNKYQPKGTHGYNNTEVLMRALFLGTGPFFREKLHSTFKVQPFKNLEVYNLICESLDIKPAPNNGTSSAVTVDNRLALHDWVDEEEYPGLNFDIDMGHILKESTYDLLFRKNPAINGEESPKPVHISSGSQPHSSLLNDESTLASFTTKPLPQQSDLVDNKQGGQHDDDKEEGQHDDDKGGNEDENKENDKGGDKEPQSGLSGILNDMEHAVGIDKAIEYVQDQVENAGHWFEDVLNSLTDHV